MTIQSNADLRSDSAETTQPVIAATRPLYWSIRRELWENRSIYVAPLAVAAVVLFSLMISMIHLAQRIRGLGALDPAKQRHTVTTPYAMGASAIVLTGFIVAAVYCLDAFSSERRDRSILFWKSLPVSDWTTVLSKVSIPLVIQPLLCMTIGLAVQLITLVLSTMVLLGSGVNPAGMWSRLPLVEMSFVMLYGVAAHVLWFAPIYSWFLLVSAWSRRAAVVWALLPFFAAFVVEKLTLGSSFVAEAIKYRLGGAMVEAFTVNAARVEITDSMQLAPIRFLTSAGLWGGLLFSVACLALAARLRRFREPV